MSQKQRQQKETQNLIRFHIDKENINSIRDKEERKEKDPKECIEQVKI